MSPRRPRLAFVSPVFLFPNDAGGKIRSTNILRGLKGGAFDITLIAPGTQEQAAAWAGELSTVCDRFLRWEPSPPRPRWRRGIDLFGTLPVNVAADSSPAGRHLVQRTLSAEQHDVVVFDFVHAAVLRPAGLDSATVCFTHNVEAEIFQRHMQQSRNRFMRALWASQYKKMKRFEADALSKFTRVIAVSDRDAMQFREGYSLTEVNVIPTGVDLQYFAWAEPPQIDARTPPTVVFAGSMDWAANVDGVSFFLESVWPAVLRQVPLAQFVVVGRDPPPALVKAGRAATNVRFTGFVDDIRPHVYAAHVFVIPLRVGGGTRIKAFEAMAMGRPVVSTTIGIEGLDVQDGVHYLRRDSAHDQADAIAELLEDSDRRRRLAHAARDCLSSRFGHIEVARVFERACLQAMGALESANRVVPMRIGARSTAEFPQ